MLRRLKTWLHYCQVLLVLLIVLKAAPKVTGRQHYKYNAYLDSQRRFHLWWDVDYKRNVVNFRLLAVVTLDEWFGVGYSAYGNSSNADFFVHWVDENYVQHCKDAWTDSKGILHIDNQQDYKILSGQLNKHALVIEYQRPFDTCDNYDFPFDVTIPAKETTYWWYTTKLPALPERQHIIQFESAITKGNENFVHHIEVFLCEWKHGMKIPYFNGPSLVGEKPKELSVCRHVIGAWAMGASALHLPAEAGCAIGGNISRNILLEVHYNNPEIKHGVKDTSGIRFYVTPTRRKYDSGVMEIGLEYTNKMAIPPHQNSFILAGDCISECTELALPDGGIYIFASQLHTHLTGKKVTIRHIRNGTELPPVNYDDHYSPHFQIIKLLPRPVHILPGDSMVIECEYNTEKRSNATIGGFAITDEMCVSYLHYYPNTNLEVCKSSIETKTLNKWFEFIRRWDVDKIDLSKGYRNSYNSVRWTPLTSHLLNKLYEISPLSMQCNQSDGRRFPVSTISSYIKEITCEDGRLDKDPDKIARDTYIYLCYRFKSL
uniref:DOMON domain-containing protein n=1 Tax=Octopus bimaculoides TaxID=37653 RepID=A0A0L8GNB5_OCTBM